MVFKDEYMGKFQGNILEAVAQFFPEPHANRILNEPILNSHWKVYERILWDGGHGFRFYTNPRVSARLFAILSDIYEAHHKDKNYPNHFDGHGDGLPLIAEADFIKAGCFVIWEVNKVQVEQ